MLSYLFVKAAYAVEVQLEQLTLVLLWAYLLVVVKNHTSSDRKIPLLDLS
jgi:hypothetical protein